ncbi:NAD(P)-dependent alcohol dehydrogenase [Isoptericola halotolerans]|uniref:NADPH:quinone reductase-like Zn-dependent oxidoreductase n=1 Tax=Isoptericola halotolerans TaxID=300560 RepID=A0ABX2A581_9MICO|nr:NAD(P)-dependent alcohol dehydrogenase [Isoptericola halotolerans]NOV96751.1 NADPH:quinone reductase-like Zn-dependent oxidoreductase [Isoptericola halotolerans]
MRAAIVQRYGPPDVVTVRDVPTPVPGRGEVLVRVHAAAVTSADARLRGARFPAGFGPLARLAVGLRGPRRPILGGVYSGVVEQVGAEVTDLSPGDRVAGMTGTRLGTHAELVAVPSARAVALPAGVTDEDGAAVLFGGTTAWHYLRRRATVAPGSRVLVTGAAGAVGTSAVQIARHLGATVTAMTSTPNLDLVARLGADHVIDRTTTAPVDVAGRFDVVVDTVGALNLRTGRRLIAPDGVLLLIAASLGQTLASVGRVRSGPAPEKPADVAELLRLVADGVLSPVVTAVVGLDELAAAHARIDAGHKVGNIVLKP